MSGPPSDLGWAVLDLKPASEAMRLATADAVARMLKRGWRCAWGVDDMRLMVGPRARRAGRLVGRVHLLIGEWRPHSGQTPAGVIGRSRSPDELARAIIREGWGAYVLVWRAEDGRLRILRDPSGAVDCVTWSHEGLTVAAEQWPEEMDALLPRDTAIDWAVLGRMIDHPQVATRQVAMTGLHTVHAGSLAAVDDGNFAQASVWRPRDCYGGRFEADPEALQVLIDRTIDELALGRTRVISELSGGLDSAIVTSSLARADPTRLNVINYYGPWPEGDERAYARAAAAKMGVDLTEVAKPLQAVKLNELRRLGQGVRPAFQGLDTTYDADMAARMTRSQALCMTGQGGDAVFFQHATPWVVADRRRRLGPLGLRPAYLADVGRWTRRSAWAVAGHAWCADDHAQQVEADGHPWLADLHALPPGKRIQIRQLVNGQTSWRDCLRHRAGPVIHPFLTQPVLEHCLAIPTDVLTSGVRDRGLARIAFGDRLPEMIRDRRNKGDLTRYYGRINRLSLPMLRRLLLGGRLAAEGVLDRDLFDDVLSPERLIWDDRHSRVMTPAVIEVWAQNWEARLRARGC